MRGWDARDRDDRPAWTAPAHRGPRGPARPRASRRWRTTPSSRRAAPTGASASSTRARRTRPSTPSASTATSFYCLATLGGDLIFTGAGDGALLTATGVGNQSMAVQAPVDAAETLSAVRARTRRPRETGGRRPTAISAQVTTWRGAGSCAWGLGAGLSAVRCVDARPGRRSPPRGDDGTIPGLEFALLAS